MEENILNFLDVIIKIINNIIEFDWFHKSMFSERYLNFFSLHLFTQKHCWSSILLSHPRYQTNLEFV